MLFAGGFGVFQLPNPASPTIGQWTPVTGPPPQNNKIPPAFVADFHYAYTKNVLVAGTLGRGAWLYGAAPAVATASIRGPSSLSLAGSAAKNPWPAQPARPYPPPSIQ